jgi:hypothetical protein
VSHEASEAQCNCNRDGAAAGRVTGKSWFLAQMAAGKVSSSEEEEDGEEDAFEVEVRPWGLPKMHGSCLLYAVCREGLCFLGGEEGARPSWIAARGLGLHN